jgi:hypothetical protein
MQAITIGRVGMDVTSGRVTKVDDSGTAIRLSGNTPFGKVTDALEIRQQLLGYADSPDEEVVPVTWDQFPHMDGYYRLSSPSVALPPETTLSGIIPWSAVLEPVQGYAAPLLESVMLGNRRASSMTISGSGWHAVPSASRSWACYRPDSRTFIPFGADEIHQGETAKVSIFNPGGNHFIAQSYCPPARFYDGAATLLVGEDLRVVTGRNIPNAPDAWRLSNDLFELEALPGGGFRMQYRLWAGTAWTPWQTIDLLDDYQPSDPGLATMLTAPHTITVLANSPTAVTIRLLTTASEEYSPVTVDLTLRRGAQSVGVELMSVFPAYFAARFNNFDAVTSMTGGFHRSIGAVRKFVGSAVGSSCANGVFRTDENGANYRDQMSFAFGIGVDVVKHLSEYFWAGNEKQTVVAR